MFASLPSLAASVAAISAPFKRAQTGLYHGVTRQSGNSVPFSMGKTRRIWLPNVHSKTYFSTTLARNVRVKVTMKARKTIQKYGSIDEYLRRTPCDLLGDEGMRLRLLLEDTKRRRKAERRSQLETEAAAVEASEVLDAEGLGGAQLAHA